MPESRAGADGGKVRAQPEQKQRVRLEQTAESGLQAGQKGMGPFSEALLGSDFSQATFERHAALLGDSRMSHRMYAGERAGIVLQLQRDYGNRYVQRLVKHISQKRAEAVQAKLTVGPAGDKYEEEADRVAKQVMGTISSPGQEAAQRQTPEEEELQMVQRQIGLEGGDVEPQVERSIQQKRDGGHAIPDGLRTSMEGAFRADFSGVRVHHDTEADALNDSMQARAFTTGQDIFFRQGEYNPDSSAGKEILAHELTHVVQQKDAWNLQPRIVERDLIRRATKPKSKLFSKERSLTKKIEKAVRKKDGREVFKHSATLFEHNSTYYLELLEYKVEKHKGSDQKKLDLYAKNTPGLRALREAWETRGKYTHLIEEIAIFMSDAEDMVNIASQDPVFFLEHILKVLRKDTFNTSVFLRMLEISELRDLMSSHNAEAWGEFTANIPQIAVAEGVYQEVQGLDLTTEQIIDRIFEAVVQNEKIDVGYYTNNLRLDSVATILRGATPEEKAARVDRALDSTKPSTPSAQCDNLMKILRKVIEMYPGLKTTFAIGMEKQALLTVPLNTLTGGLIPNTFQGNVVDVNDSYTNQIFFTGGTNTAEPRSHTWNIIGGKTYDSVLGTKGDQVAASKELAFTQRKTPKGWEDVWVSGNKTLTKLDKGVKKAAPNSMGFSTAYKRNW